MTASSTGAVLKLEARFDGQELSLGASDREILDAIESMRLVVLRRAFDAGSVSRIIADYHRFGQSRPQSNPEVRVGVENYHRIDDNPPKSKVARILRGYSTFYWNEPVSEERPFMRALMRARNRLSGLPEEFAVTEVVDGFISAPVVMHYPRGGGYMRRHSDPLSKQKCVLSVVMSRRGVDFDAGGLYVLDAQGRLIDVEAETEPGDVLVFHPQCVHGVDPIDPGPKTLWDDPRGRWMMFSTLVPLVSLNGGPVEGLKAY